MGSVGQHLRARSVMLLLLLARHARGLVATAVHGGVVPPGLQLDPGCPVDALCW
jgi:hypothetical protein